MIDDVRLSSTERRILTMISYARGKENAISRTRIAQELKLGDRIVRRTIKHLIEELRYPICSCYDGGYFIPERPEEVNETYARLRSHGISILVRAAAVKRCSLKRLLNKIIKETD
jgi:biotin operon repressor